MRRGEEGKLLAGTAGFYSPWGSERITGPSHFAECFSRHAKRETLRIVRRSLHSASLPSGWERKEWILI